MDVRAPGLWASWLNGWLAAVGVTVLVHGCRLRWSDDRRPVALFSLDEGDDLVMRLAKALPTAAALNSLVIRNSPNGHFPRNVPLACYERAAEEARRRFGDGSLALSVTDLVRADLTNLPHSPFDLSAPRGTTLWDRLVACRQELPAETADLAHAISRSLDGRGVRKKTNGLGFDVLSIEAGDPPRSGKFVDPVVECLAFYGLSLFPVRGEGMRATTRGWRVTAANGRRRRDADTFQWHVWSEPLDQWAIDALLGLLYSAAGGDGGRLRLGIPVPYSSVPYQKTGSMDPTHGYASRRG